MTPAAETLEDDLYLAFVAASIWCMYVYIEREAHCCFCVRNGGFFANLFLLKFSSGIGMYIKNFLVPGTSLSFSAMWTIVKHFMGTAPLLEENSKMFISHNNPMGIQSVGSV